MGSRADARIIAQKRLGFACQIFCTGCGCKGGPGYRKGDGSCASKAEIASGVCGEGPDYQKCTKECTPIFSGCKREPLTTAVAPPTSIDHGLKLYEVTGEDGKGRRAAFDIIMISTGLSWQYKSLDINNKATAISGSELRSILAKRLAGASDIIASGTASSEGPRSIEEKRAQARGKALAKIAEEVAPHATQIWTLNLGQKVQTCVGCSPAETANERPVFLISVAHREMAEVDLPESLRMALSRHPELPKPDAYSLFQLERVK